MRDELIGLMARKMIADQYKAVGYKPPHWPEDGQPSEHFTPVGIASAKLYKKQAESALDALIERLMDPDEGMLNAAMFDAGPVGCCAHTEETATETWQFMLSTLKPKGKTDE